jgi:hypothetical protein
MAKQCCAYIVGLYRISDGIMVSQNLLSDSFQLPWAGYDFELRNIPAEVAQYVDLVRFSKVDPGWIFLTKPDFFASPDPLKQYQGTYRFSVVVAGEGAITRTAQINVEYRNDWHNVAIYDS